MMSGQTTTIRIELSARQTAAAAKAVLCALLIFLAPQKTVTEELTLTTYYPSPYGVYEDLRATQNSYLAYAGGCVGIGSNACSKKLDVVGDFRATGDAIVGRMGVGTVSPTQTLDVNGGAFIRGLGVGTAPPASGASVLGGFSVAGSLVIADGTQGDGKVFISSANGSGQWGDLYPRNNCFWAAVSGNAGFICPADSYAAGFCFSNTLAGCSPAISGTASTMGSSGGVYCCAEGSASPSLPPPPPPPTLPDAGCGAGSCQDRCGECRANGSVYLGMWAPGSCVNVRCVDGFEQAIGGQLQACAACQ